MPMDDGGRKSEPEEARWCDHVYAISHRGAVVGHRPAAVNQSRATHQHSVHLARRRASKRGSIDSDVWGLSCCKETVLSKIIPGAWDPQQD
jgi:hypothetical protein